MVVVVDARADSGGGEGSKVAGGTGKPGARGGRRAAETPPARGAGPPAPPASRDPAGRGDKLYAAGRCDEAYAAYRTAAGLGAPDAGLELKMAASLAALQLYRPALRHCKAAIKADPSRADAYIAMGDCLSKLGRHANALAYSRRAVQRSPSDARPHNLCGVILNKLGRHAMALPYYQRAVRLDPDNVQAHQNASLSLFQLGRYKKALRHAKRAAKISPKDPASHEKVSTCLSQMGRYEKAVRPGRRAIKAAPGHVDSYFPLLTSLLGLGRHEEAVKWCARAAKADPRDPRPHFAMALSLRALGRLEEALPHCLRAIELDPANTDFHTAMSQILRNLGRLPDALSHCEAAASAKLDSLPALSNMGGILADMGRHKEAPACLAKAVRIDPRQPAPRYNRALSPAVWPPSQGARRVRKSRRARSRQRRRTQQHGNSAGHAGQVWRGLAHFDRALELSPSSAAAHHNKALSLQHLKRCKEALAHFDRALELSPSSADAYVGRHSCLAELGLPDEAIGHYASGSLGPAALQSKSDTPGAAGLPYAPVTAAAPAAGDSGRARSVKLLLSKDESEVLEFKSWPGLRQEDRSKQSSMEEKIARELCGLANTRGGDLLIGVGDDGNVEGLAYGGRRLSRKERDGMLAWASNVIVDYIGAEHGGRFDREIVEVDGLDVLHCAVVASEDGPVILKKRLDGRHDFFVRDGNTCRQLGSREMLEYVGTKWPGRASRQQPMRQNVADQGPKLEDVAKNESAAFLAGRP